MAKYPIRSQNGFPLLLKSQILRGRYVSFEYRMMRISGFRRYWRCRRMKNGGHSFHHQVEINEMREKSDS
jgi:hypothetical protein